MDDLAEGTVVKFKSLAYSHYDSATILVFLCDTGAIKQVFIPDDDDFDEAAFEEI